jgi:hypothetical protein
MSEFLFDPSVGWGLPHQFLCQRTKAYAEQFILAFFTPKLPHLVILPPATIDRNKGQNNEKAKMVRNATLRSGRMRLAPPNFLFGNMEMVRNITPYDPLRTLR